MLLIKPSDRPLVLKHITQGIPLVSIRNIHGVVRDKARQADEGDHEETTQSAHAQNRIPTD